MMLFAKKWELTVRGRGVRVVYTPAGSASFFHAWRKPWRVGFWIGPIMVWIGRMKPTPAQRARAR